MKFAGNYIDYPRSCSLWRNQIFPLQILIMMLNGKFKCVHGTYQHEITQGLLIMTLKKPLEISRYINKNPSKNEQHDQGGGFGTLSSAFETCLAECHF